MIVKYASIRVGLHDEATAIEMSVSAESNFKMPNRMTLCPMKGCNDVYH